MDKKNTALQWRDTALALAFLGLLIWLFTKNSYWIYAAMVILLVAMIYPKSMKYPARLWFGLAQVLNLVVSKIVLGIAYFLLVLPVAAVRNLMGKDSMGLKNWKKGDDSTFVVRRHRFVKEDIFRQF